MWTENQSAAINAPVGDILVTAAAGSGKTAVMVERIISRIVGEDSVDVDRMLIVTYTNAAAAEIKDRIMKAIIKKLDEDENKNLERQLVLINNASICTIHSFCLDVIKSNFNKIDLAPDFKIGAENDLEILLDDAVDIVFEQYYQNNDEDFLRLVRSYTSRDDSLFADIIKKLYRFSRSIPDSAKWLNQCSNIDDFDNYFALPVMLGLAKEAAVEVVAKYDKIIAWCRLDATLAEKIDFFAREKAPFETLINCDDWDSAYNILQTAAFDRLTMPKIEDKELVEKIKAVRNDAKKAAKNIQISYISGDTESIKAEIQIVAPAIKCMCDVTIKVAQEFAQLKKQKNIIDFSDFEHMCLQILNENGAQTAAAAEIMNRYDEIYIDEYQDCNSVQEAIFRLISGANKGCPNVFAVGDMKQSIYKFRDANPKLFKLKSDTYPAYDDSWYQPCSKILLNTNFRSRSQVIDCVNSVFRQLMTEEAGELDYTEDEYLYCGSKNYTQINRDQLGTDVVIIRGDAVDEMAVQSNDEGDSEEEQAADEVVEYTKEVAEAVYIAKRVSDIVSDPDYTVYDKQIDGFRHVEYRDIVILMRGIRANAGAFSTVFKQCGIPLFVDVNGYFDAPEIDFLINFLKIIDNPLDDIPLVAIMHHPLFGFTDNELLTIRACVKKCAFYKAVKQYCVEEDYLAEKCKRFVRLIGELWDKSKYLSVNQLLEYAINKTNYMVYLSTLNNSSVAKSNVRMLFTKAKEFETNNFKGIFNFVNYIDKIRSKGKDSDSAKLIGENDNVVRVMTIHKSKGLEFPIVFLARTTTKFNKRDLNSNILMHKDYGVGVNVIDYSRRISYPSVAKNAIRNIMLAENVSEELRILYVALTRAREKLIIVGYHNKPDNLIDSITSKIAGNSVILPKNTVLGANTYMEWILMAVLRNKTCAFEHDLYLEPLTDENSVFNCKIVGTSEIDIIPQQADNIPDISFGTDCADPDIYSRLSYVYPYKDMCTIPGNISVTELKRMALEEETPAFDMYGATNLEKPAFASGNAAVSGAHKGTLVHFVMQRIDFLRSDAEQVQQQLDAMLDKKQITQKEHAAINPMDISDFIHSPLGQEIVAHYDSFSREYSFKYLMKADEIFEGAAQDDVIIQGVIDAFFVNDNGKIVLIDYKTDKIVKSEEETAHKYDAQLRYYAIAIEKILQKEVESKYIHLFETGKTIKM